MKTVFFAFCAILVALEPTSALPQAASEASAGDDKSFRAVNTFSGAEGDWPHDHHHCLTIYQECLLGGNLGLPVCGEHAITGKKRSFKNKCKFEKQNCRDGGVWKTVPFWDCMIPNDDEADS